MIGRDLGHFEISAKLGEGGMGEVYRATDRRLGREVAIKILPPAFAADPERRARFERECRLQASLTHRNIAAIYEVGSVDGTDFLAMELVGGESLAERMAQGPLPVAEALDLALQMAEALEAAHARSIVHRDLKPANVKLSAEGEVKVLDFGLARAWRGPEAAAPDLSRSPTLTGRMTQPGILLGTAAYMSPEQARGEEADQRADIWAWGVILFEMLTGEPLFAEATASETVAAVLRAEIPWDRLPREAPPRLRTVLRRALVRDPRNRLHAIADARIELGESGAAEGVDSVGRFADPGRRRLLAAAAVVLAIGGLLGWLTRPAPPDGPPLVSQIAGGANLGAIALSPDGRRLALSREGRLYVRDLGFPVEREVSGVREVSDWTLFWSPDGRRIGYATADAIFTVSPEGGAPQQVCEVPDTVEMEGTVLGAAFRGPDRLVFALDRRGLWEVPVGGGEPSLVAAPAGEEEVAFHFPSVLPDGRTVVAVLRGRGRPSDTIAFFRGGERIDVTLPGWSIDRPRVAASGHLLFLRRETDAGLWAVRFSISSLRLEGEPFRLVEQPVSDLSLGPGSSLVYAAGAKPEASELAIVDRRGGVVALYERLSQPGIRDPELSPDGGRLAIMGVDVHDGRRALTVTPHFGMSPTWSPDGRHLIYRNRVGLFRVPADGSLAPDLLLEGDFASPHWSPDGRYVAVRTSREPSSPPTATELALGRGSQLDLSIVALDEGAELSPFLHSPANETHPRFSPDGRYLAYASDESGRYEIYLRPFPAGDRRWRVSVEGGRFPRWSPAGDEIYWVSGPRLMAARFVAGDEPEIGTPERLFSAAELPLALAAFGQPLYGVAGEDRFLVARLPRTDERPAMLIQSWRELGRGR